VSSLPSSWEMKHARSMLPGAKLHMMCTNYGNSFSCKNFPMCSCSMQTCVLHTMAILLQGRAALGPVNLTPQQHSCWPITSTAMTCTD
jgi:hypothetical protein